jgi:hypothetical protein
MYILNDIFLVKPVTVVTGLAIHGKRLIRPVLGQHSVHDPHIFEYK